jgi:hypothetical protein
MRRRDFIGLVGGAAALPLAARAQQVGAIKRIGWLSTRTENDPVLDSHDEAFLRELERLDWVIGRNLRIDARYSGGQVENLRGSALDLLYQLHITMILRCKGMR